MNWKSITTLSLFLPALVFGQAGGVAGISGTVHDATGAAVPNAKVVISSASQGQIRSITSNDAGVFAAPSLIPGPGYLVAVTATGFANYDVKDIDLQVGQNLDLNIRLQVSSNTTQVEVVATAPLIDDTKNDVSQVVNSQQIQDLPINGRRVDSFVLLTPGVTNDATFGLLSFRGVAGGNAFLIDGNDNTEQFYNENAGRTRIVSQVSQDAVQEFQVVSANPSAEYGNAMGGVVNTVTKTGSNQIHGTAFGFLRSTGMDARDTFATFNPSEHRDQVGGTIGGPFIKDKLFYFVDVDITRRNFPMVDSEVRAGIVDSNNQVWLGCALPATPAQCQAINAVLPRFFATIPRTAKNDLYFGRLDYHFSDRNTFSASFNFLRWLSPNGIQTGITSTSGAGVNGNGDDAVRVRNGKFTWTSAPRSNFVNEFRFGWSTDRQADTFDNSTLGQGLGLLQVSVAGVILGPANYLPRVEPSEQRFQFADNATLTKGRHTIKFGVDIQSAEDYTYFISNAFGNYTYTTVTQFAQDFSGAAAGARNWQTYSQTFGRPVVDATINTYGFYLQDQWRATERMTVTLGARYELPRVPQPPVANPDWPQTGHIPNPNSNIAPRLGIAYRLNDKTVLRGGFGMYYSRFLGSVVDNLWTNNGVYQVSDSLSATNPAQLGVGPTFPNTLAAPPTGASVGASTIQFASPNLRSPYSEQGTAAVERQISHDSVLTASYIWSRGVRLYGVTDLNAPPLGPNFTYTIADANGNPTGAYTTQVYVGSRPNKNYGGVYEDTNGVSSWYNALAVTFQKRFSHGFQALASYTWAHEIDDGQNTGSNALFFSNSNNWTYNGNYSFDKGSGALDQRHRLVYSFIWQPTITHRTDAISKYVINGWMLGAITTLAAGRPAGNPTVRMTDTPVTGMLFGGSSGSLDGFGGSFRVPFLPANSIYTPASYRADLRVSKIVPLTERAKLYLNFEAFNISNSWSPTSMSTQVYTETKGVLTHSPAGVLSTYGIGTADGGFPDGTQARRLQVSARVTF